MELKPDPKDPTKLTLTTDMGKVLQEAAASVHAKVDAELLRMFTWLQRVAVRAEAKDDPKHDQQAQNHALFWLREILAGRPPPPAKGLTGTEMRMTAEALAGAGKHLQPFAPPAPCGACGGDDGEHDASCPVPKVQWAYDLLVRKLKALP